MYALLYTLSIGMVEVSLTCEDEQKIGSLQTSGVSPFSDAWQTCGSPAALQVAAIELSQNLRCTTVPCSTVHPWDHVSGLPVR